MASFKFRDIKTYCSTDWLAGNTKKYRSVFDKAELGYVYCEVSFFNKLVDENPWRLNMKLLCYDADDNEICDLNCDRDIDADQPIIYVREGWGVKTRGDFWQVGNYRWEAWIEGELIAIQNFYVENEGLVKSGSNPYFRLTFLRLYEGPDENVATQNRRYTSRFESSNTRFVWMEANGKKISRKSTSLALELIFNFRSTNGYLKGSISKIFFISPGDSHFFATMGWGSDEIGTWAPGNYVAEIIFMDHLLDSIPFKVEDKQA